MANIYFWYWVSFWKTIITYPQYIWFLENRFHSKVKIWYLAQAWSHTASHFHSWVIGSRMVHGLITNNWTLRSSAEISHTELSSFPAVIGLVAATLQTQGAGMKENRDFNRAIRARDIAWSWELSSSVYTYYLNFKGMCLLLKPILVVFFIPGHQNNIGWHTAMITATSDFLYKSKFYKLAGINIWA